MSGSCAGAPAISSPWPTVRALGGPGPSSICEAGRTGSSRSFIRASSTEGSGWRVGAHRRSKRWAGGTRAHPGVTLSGSDGWFCDRECRESGLPPRERAGTLCVTSGTPASGYPCPLPQLLGSLRASRSGLSPRLVLKRRAPRGVVRKQAVVSKLLTVTEEPTGAMRNCVQAAFRRSAAASNSAQDFTAGCATSAVGAGRHCDHRDREKNGDHKREHCRLFVHPKPPRLIDQDNRVH